MSQFLDQSGLAHFKQKLDALFTTKTESAILSNRIDTLVDISTSGDESAPEVVDIRTGYDGTIYNSAGSAVRESDNLLSARIDELEDATIDPDDFDLYQDPETKMVYVTVKDENGNPVNCGDGIYIAGGGGGGGSDNNAVLTVTNTTGWLTKRIVSGASCELSISWSSLEDNVATGPGTLTVLVSNISRRVQTVNQGSVTVDVSDYLTTGSNSIKLRITDAAGNVKTVGPFTITVEQYSISSYFSSSGTFPAGSPVTFTYIPYGEAEKTVYFIVDSTQVGTSTVTASGVQQSYQLPAMQHGAHTIRCYFTVTIDGETVQSNDLYYSIIVVDSESTVPIISSTFRGMTAAQYETIVIPYTVYTPNSIYSTVSLYANDVQIGTELTVGRTEQTWSYRADTAGALSLKIQTGNVTYTIPLTITAATIDLSPVTNDLVLYLTSYGRSNSQSNKNVWEDTENDISADMTGFNFVSDGWVTDEDGVTVLRVSGDARVTIPYKPFEVDFRDETSDQNGRTYEFEFATRDVYDYDATIISCMSGGRGFNITAQRAWLAAQAASIGTQYKENEHVRISFVIEKESEHRLIYVYINGIMSGVVQYLPGASESFAQLNPVNITIGSNDCTTDIYNLRIYNNSLTRQQILKNWIADTQDLNTKLNRYDHNDVYNAYSQIVIDKLPTDLPYLVISSTELPQSKGDAKPATGYYVDPVNTSRSFSFTGASVDVQGTSSQYYARKNYKIKFNGGFTMTSSGETVSKYAMNDDAIPVKTFTFKADVASSEGANNVELVRLYNNACPYQTPPQVEDPKVRQGIDGFPIVIFWNNTSTGTTTFLGKYNFNNDKGNEDVFGFASGDESWETLQNSGDYALWKSANYTGSAWLEDYEARYPDTKPPYTDPTRLSALAAWIVSTRQDTATGNALSESYTDIDGVTHTVDNAAYRVAKFRTEAADHFELNSLLFYYVFTELFLMVDSRVKNAFPTLYNSSGKWCFLPYDMDTAIGIDNQGTLSYGYALEDTDMIGTEGVFNGQTSILWVNVRAAFFNEIKSMYQSLRSQGKLSYAVVEQMFETHQAKWPEAVFNEDAWFKYIDPLIENGNGNYLSMALGSKASQRQWWLYNRFHYLDSKYIAGDAAVEVIRLRPGAVDTGISITPYADIYATIAWDATISQQRTSRGNTVTLACPYQTVGNNVITIYNASQIASVGDLSGFKLRTAAFDGATKLQSIVVGSSAAGYTNPNLSDLTVGTNELVSVIDARNCTGLGDTSIGGHDQTTVDVSGCANIEHLYFSGTKIKGLSLPNGGILKTLQLPSTITSLVVRNHPSLTTFSIDDNDYSNITALWVENSGVYIPYRDILEAMPANSNVRLIGAIVECESASDAEDFINTLDSMRGLSATGNPSSTAVISGTMTVDDTVMQTWIDDINAKYPNLLVIPTSVTSDVIAYLGNTLTKWEDNSVTSIRNYAFAKSTALTTVKTSAATINPYAFYNCTGLNTVDLTSVDPITISANAFNASRARRTIIRSNAVSTLSATSAFEDSRIKSGYGAIYVPDDLVTAYKTSTNWSSFAKQIYPISADPVTDFSTIEDDWETILSNPNYATDYAIGDRKQILIDDIPFYVTIIAKNADVLSSDTTQKASLTWLLTTLYDQDSLSVYMYQMNTTNTNAISATDASQYNTGLNGWPSTKLRYWLRETVLPAIHPPEDPTSNIIQNSIKAVEKTYYDRPSGSVTNTCSDTIWIPSVRECGGAAGESSGVVYSNVFSSDANRKRNFRWGGAAAWWLRSSNTGSNAGFRTVSDAGQAGTGSYANASYTRGVVFGFCT